MLNFSAQGIDATPGGAIEQRVRCIQCDRGPRDRTLGVNIETGAFHCFRCNWAGRVGGDNGAPVHRIARIPDPAVAERKRERLRRLWKEAVSLTHDQGRPVRNYLESRALGEILENPPKALRAHPGIDYWDKTEQRSLGTFPAMVALFTGAVGDPVTLHITYLRVDGFAKAAVPIPKKFEQVPVQGATKGGAIQLYAPSNGVLGIAEGIETALSLRLLNGIPTWAAACADNLARIRLPETLSELHIGVDVDSSGVGEKVARALAARVAAWKPKATVTLWRPDMPGPADLNDELRRKSM